MKSLLIILIVGTILALTLAQNVHTMIPHLGPVHSYQAPVYKLQLNDPPRQRWQNIVPHFKQPLQHFLKLVDALPIPKFVWSIIGWYAKNIYLDKEFVEETEGIAEASEIDFPKIFALNFFYEINTAMKCSGIIVRNSNNTIIHGRNLDFEFWGYFSQLLARVQFYRGENLVFESDQVIGSIFVLTGAKPGKFAINVDSRRSHDFFGVMSALLIKQYIPSSYLVRKVLDEESNFNDAINRLNSTPIAGPIYYIVSGVAPNDGAVLERQIIGSKKIHTLDDKTWYLIQTNYDQGENEPWYDRRINPAEKRINDIGQNDFTVEEMNDGVMKKWPTFNIATFMTAVITPANSYYNTTVWYNSTWF